MATHGRNIRARKNQVSRTKLHWTNEIFLETHHVHICTLLMGFIVKIDERSEFNIFYDTIFRAAT